MPLFWRGNAEPSRGGDGAAWRCTGFGQLAEHAEHYHRAIGHHVAACGYSSVLLVNPDARTAALRAGCIDAGMPAERVYDVLQAGRLAETLEEHIEPDTVIYCKGGQRAWLGPQIDELCGRLERTDYRVIAGGGQGRSRVSHNDASHVQ